MSAPISSCSAETRHLWIISCLLALGACGEHTTINQYYYSAAGGAGSVAAPSPSAGTSSGSASAGTSSVAGQTNGVAGQASGGAGGNAGQNAVGSSGSGEGGVAAEAGAAGEGEAAGQAGAAGMATCVGAARGSMLVPDFPADCHALTCDGFGHEIRVVYQNNAPKSGNPCLIGTCDSAGNSSTEPARAGTPCRAEGGGVVCDGAGICAECLHTSDCPSGLSCSATERCVSAPCTDVDCGGACPPCADGKQCLVDADCAGYACDTATLTCMSNQCADHQQDGNETDADCGGGTCAPCAFGKSCHVSSDCVTFACDGISLVCVSDACSDRRQDGAESDVDCGGGACSACGVGRRCNSNFDCISGHFCNSASPRVCQ